MAMPVQHAAGSTELGGVSAGGPIAASRTFYFGAFEEYRQTRKAAGAPRPHGADGRVPRRRFQRAARSAAPLGTDAAGQAIYRGAIFDPATRWCFPAT